MRYSNSGAHIRDVQDEDIKYLSWNLRAADVHELYAIYGHTNTHASLTRSARLSEDCKVGIGRSGKPAIIMGIGRVSPRACAVWAMATPDIKDNRSAFLRMSRPQIQKWFDNDPDLQFMYNFTHSNNTQHHRWLRWVGATMLPSVTFGALGDWFVPFVIRKEPNYV